MIFCRLNFDLAYFNIWDMQNSCFNLLAKFWLNILNHATKFKMAAAAMLNFIGCSIVQLPWLGMPSDGQKSTKKLPVLTFSLTNSLVTEVQCDMSHVSVPLRLVWSNFYLRDGR